MFDLICSFVISILQAPELCVLL